MNLIEDDTDSDLIDPLCKKDKGHVAVSHIPYIGQSTTKLEYNLDWTVDDSIPKTMVYAFDRSKTLSSICNEIGKPKDNTYTVALTGGVWTNNPMVIKGLRLKRYKNKAVLSNDKARIVVRGNKIKGVIYP